MRLKFIIIYLSIVLSFPVCSEKIELSTSQTQQEFSLIVGKPYKIKYSKQLQNDSEIYLAAKYIAYFKDYEIIHGNLKKGKVLKIEIQASSKLSISYYDEIYVVVADSQKNILESVKWGEPIYNICMYRDDISKFGMNEVFSKIKKQSDINCVSFNKHQKNNDLE